MKRLASVLVLIAFCFSNLSSSLVFAQTVNLPAPGTMVGLSPKGDFPLLKGLRLNPDNPLKMDFIIEPNGAPSVTKEDAALLARYFLAALAMPKQDTWVNLSPYESQRIVPQAMADTDLGKDLLGQDYILKQLASSLTYPESETGKAYWQLIQGANSSKTSATNNFNKVWIIPNKSSVYENGNTVLISESSLAVKTEEDYLAMQNNQNYKSQITDYKLSNDRVGATLAVAQNRAGASPAPTLNPGTEPFKTHILPLIEQDVNQGKNFAQLRQIYSALILAEWFKHKFFDSFYHNYINQAKTKGITIDEKGAKDKIYALYLEAFKKGAYNYTKKVETQFIASKRITKRQYFSGGASAATLQVTPGPATQPSSSAVVARGQVDAGASGKADVQRAASSIAEDPATFRPNGEKDPDIEYLDHGMPHGSISDPALPRYFEGWQSHISFSYYKWAEHSPKNRRYALAKGHDSYYSGFQHSLFDVSTETIKGWAFAISSRLAAVKVMSDDELAMFPARGFYEALDAHGLGFTNLPDDFSGRHQRDPKFYPDQYLYPRFARAAVLAAFVLKAPAKTMAAIITGYATERATYKAVLEALQYYVNCLADGVLPKELADAVDPEIFNHLYYAFTHKRANGDMRAMRDEIVAGIKPFLDRARNFDGVKEIKGDLAEVLAHFEGTRQDLGKIHTPAFVPSGAAEQSAPDNRVFPMKAPSVRRAPASSGATAKKAYTVDAREILGDSVLNGQKAQVAVSSAIKGLGKRKSISWTLDGKIYVWVNANLSAAAREKRIFYELCCRAAAHDPNNFETAIRQTTRIMLEMGTILESDRADFEQMLRTGKYGPQQTWPRERRRRWVAYEDNFRTTLYHCKVSQTMAMYYQKYQQLAQDEAPFEDLLIDFDAVDLLHLLQIPELGGNKKRSVPVSKTPDKNTFDYMTQTAVTHYILSPEQILGDKVFNDVMVVIFENPAMEEMGKTSEASFDYGNRVIQIVINPRLTQPEKGQRVFYELSKLRALNDPKNDAQALDDAVGLFNKELSPGESDRELYPLTDARVARFKKIFLRGGEKSLPHNSKIARTYYAYLMYYREALRAIVVAQAQKEYLEKYGTNPIEEPSLNDILLHQAYSDVGSEGDGNDPSGAARQPGVASPLDQAMAAISNFRQNASNLELSQHDLAVLEQHAAANKDIPRQNVQQQDWRGVVALVRFLAGNEAQYGYPVMKVNPVYADAAQALQRIVSNNPEAFAGRPADGLAPMRMFFEACGKVAAGAPPRELRPLAGYLLRIHYKASELNLRYRAASLSPEGRAYLVERARAVQIVPEKLMILYENVANDLFDAYVIADTKQIIELTIRIYQAQTSNASAIDFSGLMIPSLAAIGEWLNTTYLTGKAGGSGVNVFWSRQISGTRPVADVVKDARSPYCVLQRHDSRIPQSPRFVEQLAAGDQGHLVSYDTESLLPQYIRNLQKRRDLYLPLGCDYKRAETIDIFLNDLRVVHVPSKESEGIYVDHALGTIYLVGQLVGPEELSKRLLQAVLAFEHLYKQYIFSALEAKTGGHPGAAKQPGPESALVDEKTRQVLWSDKTPGFIRKDYSYSVNGEKQQVRIFKDSVMPGRDAIYLGELRDLDSWEEIPVIAVSESAWNEIEGRPFLLQHDWDERIELSTIMWYAGIIDDRVSPPTEEMVNEAHRIAAAKEVLAWCDYLENKRYSGPLKLLPRHLRAAQDPLRKAILLQEWDSGWINSHTEFWLKHGFSTEAISTLRRYAELFRGTVGGEDFRGLDTKASGKFDKMELKGTDLKDLGDLNVQITAIVPFRP